MLDPHLIVDWLDATQYVKNIRESDVAAEAFSKLLARGAEVSHEQLAANLHKLSYTTLRKARVRLDAVALLVWRLCVVPQS